MCWHVLLCSGWVLLVMLLLLLHLLLLLLQWMVNIRQRAGFEWCIWSSMRYDWFQSSIRWYMLQIVEYCYHCYWLFEMFCLQINCYDLHTIISDDVRWQGSEWWMQYNTDYLLVWLVKQTIVYFFVSNNLQSKDIINIYLTNSYSSSISNRSQILYFYSPFPLQEKKTSPTWDCPNVTSYFSVPVHKPLSKEQRCSVDGTSKIKGFEVQVTKATPYYRYAKYRP